MDEIFQQTSTNSSFIGEFGLLFRNIFSDLGVASICDSSSYTVSSVLTEIDFTKTRTILEFGPGSGVLTKAMLGRMNGCASLLAIERNPSLAEYLAKGSRDQRLSIVQGSALEAIEISSWSKCKPDVIVSGIPLSWLSPDETKKLLNDCSALVGKNGKFIMYQAWLPPLLPKANLYKELKKCFSRVKRKKVLLNFPPLEVIICQA